MGFAIGSLVATIVWHFPQYAMCGAVGVDLVDLVTGAKIAPWVIGIVALVFCTWITWSYGSGARGVRIYEQVLKWLVWMVVFAFAAVVIKLSAVGQVDWGAVARGFFTFQLPEDISGRGGTVLFGALGAAVGINMVFLYPYTLLARGWGKEHRECSRFDLAVGMFLPYALATSLMIIATAATIYGTDAVPEQGTSLQPVDAAKVLAPVAGVAIGRLVFGLGILGMTLSTITLHMLVSGFIICEMLGWEPSASATRVATLAPAVGSWNRPLTKLLDRRADLGCVRRPASPGLHRVHRAHEQEGVHEGAPAHGHGRGALEPGHGPGPRRELGILRALCRHRRMAEAAGMARGLARPTGLRASSRAWDRSTDQHSER